VRIHIATLRAFDVHPRIVILGAGGIGKTTLALSVMPAAEITERYAKRYFIICEAATTVDLLLSEMADVVGITSSQIGS
jgi:predicted ATPase